MASKSISKSTCFFNLDWCNNYFNRRIVFNEKSMRNISKLFKIQFILKAIPLIAVLIISGFLFYHLKQDKDPSIPTSALLNKKVPEIESSDLL